MTTAREILDAVGRDEIIGPLFGVKHDVIRARKSLSQAAWRGSMPASWFDVIEKLCAEKGIECPRNLFNWKEAPQNPPLEDAS